MRFSYVGSLIVCGEVLLLRSCYLLQKLVVIYCQSLELQAMWIRQLDCSLTWLFLQSAIGAAGIVQVFSSLLSYRTACRGNFALLVSECIIFVGFFWSSCLVAVGSSRVAVCLRGWSSWLTLVPTISHLVPCWCSFPLTIVIYSWC